MCARCGDYAEYDIYHIYTNLDSVERIAFLEWVNTNDKHKYDYAMLTPSQRKFFDEKIPRHEGDHVQERK